MESMCEGTARITDLVAHAGFQNKVYTPTGFKIEVDAKSNWNWSPDLGGKRLEPLKELLPGLARVAVLWNGPIHTGGGRPNVGEKQLSRSMAPRFGFRKGAGNCLSDPF